MEIEYREYKDSDREVVISLLKKSLGEGSSKKTIDYWTWKHEANPFGRSPVLVAASDNAIIGVRAMLRWQWQQGVARYHCLRAVDTATDPSFQGRGIFSQLTRRMLDDASGTGIDFIYNTPNEKSAPGYLKLGWSSLGKLKVGLALRIGTVQSLDDLVLSSSEEDLEVICNSWNALMAASGRLFTPKSADYLQWRYLSNPLISYQVIQAKDFFLAVHVRKRKIGKELRISECIWRGDEKSIAPQLWRSVLYLATMAGARLISFSPSVMSVCKASIRTHMMIGPLFAYRPVNHKDIRRIQDFDYQIGDLELF